jgi:hypothetical protein
MLMPPQVTAQEVLKNTFHLEVDEAEIVIVYDHDTPSFSALDKDGFTSTLVHKLQHAFPCVLFVKGRILENNPPASEYYHCYGAIARKHMADLLIARFPPQNPPHSVP